MGSPSRYWKLVRLDSAGKCQVAIIDSAKAFFHQQFPKLASQIDVPDVGIQKQLLALTGNSLNPSLKPSVSQLMVERCLRCFISNQIEQVCIQLEVRFGREHGFTRSALFPFVLDDAIENFRDEKPQLSRGSHQRTYRPLSVEILQAFDPKRASLSTWTTRLVKHHRELNVFLLEHGVYLVSDWAILNDTTPKQLGRILGEFHHLTSEEIQLASLLLESYHAVYRRDRLKQRQAGAKGKCQPPSTEQLQKIAHLSSQKANLILSPEETLSQLQDLAERLRQYRIHVRGGFSVQESLDRPETQGIVERIQITAAANESEENNQGEFLTFYRQQFTDCLDKALERVTQARFSRLQRKDSQKAQQFLTALKLFHCQGRSMSEIAPLVELQAQYQVTRLLKLKEFRADIRQQMLKDLRDRTLAKALDYATPEQLQKLEQQVEVALDEQIGAVMREAETEASIASNRSANSLFAKHLCRHLDRRRN